LLTDFRDAPEETLPGDDGCSAGAGRGRAAEPEISPARPRPLLPVSSAAPLERGEGVWMGYERKRGKLAEFNALLRGGSRDAFPRSSGETAILPAIKYVITLDTDTQLPREAARSWWARWPIR
jgi:cyclic beta-1,2-glucan synthetase